MIKNQTLVVEYQQTGVFFSIESSNNFTLGYSNSLNASINYFITNAALNCSSSYSSTEKFFAAETREKIAGASCNIIAPILFDMNFTVTGSTSMNFTGNGTTNSYESYSQCKSYIFINVTKPSPKP